MAERAIDSSPEPKARTQVDPDPCFWFYQKIIFLQMSGANTNMVTLITHVHMNRHYIKSLWHPLKFVIWVTNRLFLSIVTFPSLLRNNLQQDQAHKNHLKFSTKKRMKNHHID